MSGAVIAAIAIADWWTKPYVSFGMLYVFPIVLAAGFLPRAALLILGALCAALSEAFSSLDPTWRFSRFLLETLALSGCGLFLSELLRNRRLETQTGQQQQRTQERLHTLVETSPAAIVSIGQEGIIELANQAAVDLVGQENGSLVGAPIADYLPELRDALCADGRTQVRTAMECQVRRANGECFPAEVWFSTFKENGATKLAAIIADITEKQSAGTHTSDEAVSQAGRPSLNSRQQAVLRLVFEGLHNAEIEVQLQMTPSAVKNTLQQLFVKAGAKNRSQLVRAALEHYRDLL